MAHLVSFVGTGPYGIVQYAVAGRAERISSRFAAAVIVRSRAGTAGAIDSVSLLVTPQARAHANYQGVLEALQTEAGLPEGQIATVEIPNTTGPTEIWTLFSSIRHSVQDHPRIVFDITHGFRSLPFVAGAVLAFEQSVRDGLEVEILYGEIAGATGDLRDLTEVISVQRWAQDLRLFLKTGRFEDAAHARARDSARTYARDNRDGRLGILADRLLEVSRDLQTLRTGGLLLGYSGAQSSVSRAVTAIDRVATDEGGAIGAVLPALMAVLDQVRAMLEPLNLQADSLEGAEGQTALKALADLYRQLGRPVEALATIREGFVSALASRNAARPAQSDHSREARDAAEQRSSLDQTARQQIHDTRNRVLHAEYQAEQLRAGAVFEALDRARQRWNAPATPMPEAEMPALPRAGFLNLSNHPLETWSEAQRAAAQALTPGEALQDLPFPEVEPEATTEAVAAEAQALVESLSPLPRVAMVQGDFTLTHALVTALQRQGVRCVAATTARLATPVEGGMLRGFAFVAFRDYSGNPGDPQQPPQQQDAAE